MNRVIAAELKEISTHFYLQHPVDQQKARAIAETMEQGREIPLLLVLQDEGNGYAFLDGHHRAEAAYYLGLQKIKAWVVSIHDYAAIIEQHFDGETPNRISELDDYIVCNGLTYAELQGVGHPRQDGVNG